MTDFVHPKLSDEFDKLPGSWEKDRSKSDGQGEVWDEEESPGRRKRDTHRPDRQWANTHDKKLVERTFESMPVERPEPTEKSLQNICMDNGYDFPDIRGLVDQWGYTAHISARGEDQSKRQRIPGYRARRWVVERAHSWMNRFRRLLVRWEKKAENHFAMLHLACAWIAYQQSGLFALARA